MVLEEMLVAKAFDFGLLFADLGGIMVVDKAEKCLAVAKESLQCRLGG